MEGGEEREKERERGKEKEGKRERERERESTFQQSLRPTPWVVAPGQRNQALYIPSALQRNESPFADHWNLGLGSRGGERGCERALFLSCPPAKIIESFYVFCFFDGGLEKVGKLFFFFFLLGRILFPYSFIYEGNHEPACGRRPIWCLATDMNTMAGSSVVILFSISHRLTR